VEPIRFDGGEMNIYHITYTPKIKTANLYFYGCNFNCLGCIRKKNPFDLSLKERPMGKIRFLSLDEVLRALGGLGAERAILMGGEPTVDPTLPVLTERLHGLKIESYLLTNGHALKEKLLENVDGVCVSIKALSDDLHRKFTGKSNKRVLENFRKIHDYGVPLSAETIYIPGLVEVEEIGKIAQFISSIDPGIPYHIDAYIPVNDLYRAPSPQEIKNAVKEAKKYLKKVTFLCGDEKPKYEVFNIV
jgi:pyruvate-formate lyase-activating enzyme